jgi:tRNA/tmRNA/rRNA uracil-C5-methylase (TrmA/RlmC/RlmD family)
MSKVVRKRGAPEPGDLDYKTPTQLRNARKRKKTKQEKQVARLARSSSDREDPSLRYLSNPTSAPVIQHAVSFFEGEDQEFEVKIGQTTEWRTVAKLAVRNQNGVLRIGLFVPGSHDLLEIPQCQAHHPRINSAIEVIQKKCRKHSIKPFDEKTGKGSLKHVAINVERGTGFQQVTLVWNDGESEQGDINKLEMLCEALILTSKSNDERFNLHSLWVHYNKSNKHANSIFDREGKWERQFGEDMVVEHLQVADSLTVPLNFPPQVFRQANLDAFTNIIIKIRSWLQDHQPKRCLELYGGVGTIGLHIADLCESFVSSDENPFNKICFEKTVLSLPRNKCKTIFYESKNATDMTQSSELDRADLVIVDPPRKGLDPEVVKTLCKKENLKTLIYVSCGFDAFTRDFQNLTTKGKWRLEHAEGHVLFPGSDAIETLAIFQRF